MRTRVMARMVTMWWTTSFSSVSGLLPLFSTFFVFLWWTRSCAAVPVSLMGGIDTTNDRVAPLDPTLT